MSSRVRSARGESRGFSLIELMVVVMIIGILAALAMPTMSSARYDQAAYVDAGNVMQLFREARTRAVARGGAQMVTMSANGTGDRGTFKLYESVGVDPTGTGANRLPVANCTSPSNWTTTGNPLVIFVDGVNLNTGANSIEATADIETAIYNYNDPTNATAAAVGTAALCYTPLGRSYLYVGTGTPSFDAVLSSVGVLEMRVTRAAGGNIRSVLVPPNGMARLFSHT